MANKLVKFVTQKESAYIDELLMGKEIGYTSEQLMELAGLSVASSILKKFPPSANKNVLTICGPGNNGGDGIIASRHLIQFGYKVDIYYPKRNANNEFFKKLILQAKTYGVRFLESESTSVDELFTEGKYQLIVDAIFGYSFKNPSEIRSPFNEIIKNLNIVNQDKCPIVSVDVPSGWDVEIGNVLNSFTPKLLISLGSPKKCALQYKGDHFLGGRFMPTNIEAFSDLNIPEYPGSEQIVDITNINNQQ